MTEDVVSDVMHDVPLFREDGSPVLDDQGEQITRSLPVYETYEEEVTERTGPDETKQSIRPDQVAFWMIAGLEALHKESEQRIEALEAENRAFRERLEALERSVNP